MGLAESKEIYKERARTAELVNAQARNRSLYGVKARGKAKALAVVLWYVLVHDMGRLKQLRAATRGEGAR